MNYIINVESGSIAEEMGIERGDILLAVNGCEISDIFDYRYNILDEYVEILIKKSDGEEWELEIEKDEREDLGIEFENALMDKAKSCKNKCIFCFIDQMPKGMRDTLYFKDDDSRLSFLQGNYVTLTNMTDKDIDRIVYYHLSPINISVHATDPKVRRFMLKNPESEKIMNHIKKLAHANIQMNYQVVLCKNVNDKDVLDKTIKDLSEFIPNATSLSVVPIGITSFRDNLYHSEPFTRQDYEDVLSQIHRWQVILKEKYGNRFVFASDEFYLNARKEIPSEHCYEDFPQIENGVGMIRSFQEEFVQALQNAIPSEVSKKISIITGTLAEPFIDSLVMLLSEKFPNIQVNVCPISNDFFGNTITVSGLITGVDIINQLKGQQLGEYVVLPENSLRKDDIVFLDDYTIEEVQNELGTHIVVSKIDGHDFLLKIIGNTEEYHGDCCSSG